MIGDVAYSFGFSPRDIDDMDLSSEYPGLFYWHAQAKRIAESK